MEPHLQHTQGHHYDDPNTGAGAATLHTGNDEDEHHGEKKSVMKKVREKAKKLKNTITKSKHGHGHGHGGDDHHNDDDGDDDDDDDDEEMEENPEVHGAPIYDSAKIGLARDSLERPSVMAEDRYGRSDVAEPEAKHGAPPPVSTGPYGTNLSEPSGLGHPHGQEVNPKQWSGKIGQSTGMEEDPFNPVDSRTHQEELRGSIGKSTGMVTDPNDSKDPSLAGSDPSNYETKVSDPTHTGTTDREELRGNIGKSTGMAKDPNDRKDPSLAGSDPSNYETKVSDPTHTGATHQEGLRGSIGKSRGMVKDPNDPKDPSLAGSDPSNFETKVSDPTHTGGKEAELSQKFDKMGIHESDPKSFDPNQPENLPRETLTGNPSSRSSSYVEKISSSASAIVDKATDVVAPKLGYSGKFPSNEPHETITKKPVSYTGKVTETLAPVYSKVVDAGSSVFSKVQGSVSRRPPEEGATTTVEKGKEGDKEVPSKEPHETATKPVSSVTGKVTETLAPVYSKVVNAGSSVISKVQGSVSGQPPVESATKTVEKGKEGDKGVTVKEYVVETLRPGDDDKALSEVITQAFHRGKHEETEKKAGEDIPAPVGTVTESEAVRQQLGSDHHHDHDHDHDHSNNVVAGRGVADRLKDAVGSWFGGKGNAPEGTGGTSYVTDEGLSTNKPTPTENRDGGK